MRSSGRRSGRVAQVVAALATLAGPLVVATQAPATPAERAPAQAVLSAASRSAQTLAQGSTVGAQLAVNDAGIAYAVWAQARGPRLHYQIRAARRTPSGRWARPVALSRWFAVPATGKLLVGGRPQVGVDDAGRATVVWSQPDGPILRIRTATHSGRGWSPARWLSPRRQNAFNPGIAVAGAGHRIVYWQGGRPNGRDWPVLARYRAAGDGWEPTERLDDNLWEDSHHAEAVIDDRGVATVVWDEQTQNPTRGRVPVATRSPGTPWSTTILFERTNHPHLPQPATTRDGRLVVAWADNDQVLAAPRSPDGTWGPAETVVPPSSAAYPLVRHVAITESGLVAASYELADVDRPGDQARYALATQGGPGLPWVLSPAGPFVKRPFTTPFVSSMAMDRRGGVTLTWDRQSALTRDWYDVHVSRRRPDGTWRPPFRIPGVVADVQVAADGRSRITMLWSQGRDAYEDRCCDSLRAKILPPS